MSGARSGALRGPAGPSPQGAPVGALVVAVVAALVVALAGSGAAPDASLPPDADRAPTTSGPVLGPAAPSAAPDGAVPGAATAAPAPGPAPGPAPVPAARPAAPLALTAPTIGVATGPLIPLGLDAAGAMEVPADATGTGWYVHSPAPGDTGPSVLAAHVDYGGAPGAFARLGELRSGDPITVRRADGTDVVFVVDRVERHPKAAFPTAAVYGDTPGPELRLITCGGAFDDASGHYVDNVVAFAHRV